MNNTAFAVLAIGGIALAYVLLRKRAGQDVTLYPIVGGNEVTYVGSDKAPAEALASILDKVSAVWWWDQSNEEWFGYSPTAPDWANNLKMMGGGLTYLIYVTEECVWNTAGD